MSLPPLTYLTTDSLAEGVGSSQVLAYVSRLAARGVFVNLHSFEKGTLSQDLKQRLEQEGIRWTPHPFGSGGSRGGLMRVVTGARAVRHAPLVHARSDLPAASAMLGRASRWVWDVRSLWADQRIAVGALRAGGPEDNVLRRVEHAAARDSGAIITLTEAVIPVLDARHGGRVAPKTTVIPTCVDLTRFTATPMPPAEPLRLLLAGTISAYYDVPTMLRLVEAGQRRRRAQLCVLTPASTAWDACLGRADARRESASPEEVPSRLRQSHVGLSVCREDAGVSLTAAMPTKIAEFLAVGRPVVVNPTLGDAARLLEQSSTGVVLHDVSDGGLDRAWERLESLVEDEKTPERCRALAERHFDLDQAVDRLLAVYERASQRW